MSERPEHLEIEQGAWLPRQRIAATAVVEDVRSDRHGLVSLPNGKKSIGFLDQRETNGSLELRPGLEVKVEMNPYDMSRARIVGLVGR